MANLEDIYNLTIDLSDLSERLTFLPAIAQFVRITSHSKWNPLIIHRQDCGQ
jgi:hypothetical protein